MLISGPVREAAVAGTWYPDDPAVLAAEVDGYLEAARVPPRDDVQALIAPHAGLIYSGPVAGFGYQTIRAAGYDVVVLVGPSHFVAFRGVAIYPRGAFASPLGQVPVDAALGEQLQSAASCIVPVPRAHLREHALEMQLPFLCRVAPGTPIVPLLIGSQDRETIVALADALARCLEGRRVLLVASTDLSHYFDATEAARLDGRVVQCVGRFDWAGLLEEFERYPDHERGRYVACGGGAAIAVMRAAAALGATTADVLKRDDSSAVSGDRSQVVGYLAAVFGPGRD